MAMVHITDRLFCPVTWRGRRAEIPNLGWQKGGHDDKVRLVVNVSTPLKHVVAFFFVVIKPGALWPDQDPAGAAGLHSRL